MRGRIGLFGLGAFGRLVADRLPEGSEILAHDPGVTDIPAGRTVLSDLATAAACPVVILAVPVGAMADVLVAIAPHLRPGALVVDVGSVKMLPARLMDEFLPAHVEAVGTHPLFGPQSGREGIAGLRIAVCPIRSLKAARRVAAYCRHHLDLNVYFASPEEHDREAAIVQGLTHLIARVLVAMEPLPHRMTTASFERLLEAIDMVRDDPPTVFSAIQRDNPFAAEVRERFFRLAAETRAELDCRDSLEGQEAL
ncbi:prephenate dehydrogenase [uncultured Brevundimonas sp.]|uniref:prephenate dehydrogenase n=1 Tax=uncultured Brevundimonas sp. TaxID=213418 RepID=UPI0030EB5204